MKTADLQQLHAKVEAPHFAAELGVANGERLFWKILERHPLVQALDVAARDFPGAVLFRLAALASRETDPRFANPSDAALAAYGWALRDSKYAAMSAQLLDRAERVWWSQLVAARLRQMRKSKRVEFSIVTERTEPQPNSLENFKFAVVLPRATPAANAGRLRAKPQQGVREVTTSVFGVAATAAATLLFAVQTPKSEVVTRYETATFEGSARPLAPKKLAMQVRQASPIAWGSAG